MRRQSSTYVKLASTDRYHRRRNTQQPLRSSNGVTLRVEVDGNNFIALPVPEVTHLYLGQETCCPTVPSVPLFPLLPY